jgi:hypothetical protein
MTTPDYGPMMVLLALGLIVFRRVRRQFGRQAFTPKRQVARLVVLAIVMAVLLVAAFMQPAFALPIGAGLAIGALIAAVNLRLTRFEWTPAGDYYYPHPFVGAVLSLLLVARLMYRYQQLGGMTGMDGQPPPLAQQSPLTFGLLALLVGYYVAYSIGLLVVRHRHHRDAAV